MGNFVKAAKKPEITEGAGKVLNIEGNVIALFNVGGKIYAIDNTCKHRGGPLGEGALDSAKPFVTCPWHGWQYDVTSGDCLTRPGIGQKKYNVKVEGEDILVEI